MTVFRELILPPTSLFAMLALGIFIRPRHPRTSRALTAGAISILFLLCTGVGARLLVSPLEAMTQALVTARGSDAEAIVVLGAGRYAHAPEYGGDEIPDYIALARLRYAVRLYRETGLPIMVSGGGGTPDGRLKPASENTAENAAYSARMLKQEHIGRILLVTDAMHMPRAVMSFTNYGIDVVPAPTIFFSAGHLSMSHFLPDAEHLRRSHYAVYKWVGLLWYSLRIAWSSIDPPLKDE